MVSTLRLNWPIGQTVLLTLIFFGISFLILELLLNSNWITAYLPTPSRGGLYQYLDVKYAILERFAQAGPVDCVFIGSSIVNNGFDPVAFQAGYRAQTNREIRCFNFGLEGLAADHFGEVAQIIVDEFRPRLIIYGAIARDYSEITRQGNWQNVDTATDSDWAQYRLGNFSWSGWLIDHSATWRYYLTLRESLSENRQSLPDYATLLTETGHKSIVGIRPETDLSRIITPSDFADIHADFELAPESLEGLRALLALRQEGLTVIVVEAPFHPGFINAYGQGQADHDDFILKMTYETQMYNVPFFSLSNQHTVPANGWFDHVHLNRHGAQVYSQQLGAQYGQWVLKTASVP